MELETKSQLDRDNAITLFTTTLNEATKAVESRPTFALLVFGLASASAAIVAGYLGLGEFGEVEFVAILGAAVAVTALGAWLRSAELRLRGHVAEEAGKFVELMSKTHLPPG